MKVMLEDYFKSTSQYANEQQLKSALEMTKAILPNIVKLMHEKSSHKTRLLALKLARIYADSNRNKIIVITDFNHLNSDRKEYRNYEFLPINNMSILCEKIATSEERVAAIIINSTKASFFYYKKVREIASAENAILIWDILDKTIEESKIPSGYTPDIVCFKVSKSSYWLALTRTLI